MTRYEMFKNMSIDEMADKIIALGFIYDYCKSDCEDTWEEPLCQNEKQCCIKWLKEEVKC